MSRSEAIMRLMCYAASGASVSLLLAGEFAVAAGIITFVALTLPRL